MEKKEMKQPIPGELKDEQLEAVAGGKGVTDTIVKPIVNRVTHLELEKMIEEEIMKDRGRVGVFPEPTVRPDALSPETTVRPDALSSAHSALEAYRSEVQTLADEPALPSELELRK